MHQNTRLLTFLLVTSPLLAACDQSSTDPGSVLEFENSPLASNAELEISVNPELTNAAIESVEIALGAQNSASSQALLETANQMFATAQVRFSAGDPVGAMAAGLQAREALSDALIQGLGDAEVDFMIDEAEGVVTTLSVDGSTYADPASLSAKLAGLVDSARTDKQNDRAKDAGEKMVRARQHIDRARKDGARMHDRPNDILTRDVFARLQVAQGGKAISLAQRLIGDSPTDLQIRFMTRAIELQRKAEFALSEGYKGRAASLAHNAEIKALQAVVIPDGVDDRDIHTVAEASTALLEEATAAVEAGESAIDLALLKRATRLYNAGLEKLEAGNVRGVVLLWHSATMSAVIIG